MAFDLSMLSLALVGGLMFAGSITAVKKKRGWGNNKRNGAKRNKLPGGNKAGRAMRAVGSKKKKKLDNYIDERLDEI